MKFYFSRKLSRQISSFILLTSSIFLKIEFSNAEYLFEELEIDSTTKIEEESSVIPTNPFEIVEMIRRYNSLNDATQPSVAIDNALESFNKMEQK